MLGKSEIGNIEEVLQRLKELEKENKELKTRQRYGLIWEDSPEELDSDTIVPVLREVTDKRIELDEGGGVNYLLEGDNYHSLKVLQHTHKGKVDVIYIDPPYNTGNEFVYNDKIVDKEDSFRHSKWLSFMSKRLKLAKNLMTDDGVIFVSIDDNEQAQLKLLMDSIFGEKNFVANFIWKKDNGGNRKNVKKINKLFEYILIYKKQESVTLYENKKIPKMSNPDNDPRGDWFNANISSPVTKENEKNVYTLDIQGHLIKRRWFKDKNIMEDYVKDNKIYLPIKSDGNVGVPRLKLFKEDFLNSKNIMNNYYEYKGTSDGVGEVSNMEVDFDYPKPVDLIKHLVSSIDRTNITVLDFFAGSGTTGHAVMELNKEDGGNRKFILCTNNEVSEEKVREHFIQKWLLDKNTKTAFNKFKEENEGLVKEFMLSNEYKELGIARSVTYERNRKVIEGYVTPKGKEVDGIPSNLRYLETVAYDRDSITNPLIRVGLLEEVKVLHEMAYPSTEYDNYYFKMYDKIEIINKGKPITVLLGGNEEENEVMVDEIREQGYTEVIYRTIENYI